MSKPRREGEGSRVGELAEIHKMVQALEADPSLRWRLPRPKPRTAEEARQMAELRANMEDRSYRQAHYAEAMAEARRRFDAWGGTDAAWAELGDLDLAARHAVYDLAFGRTEPWWAPQPWHDLTADELRERLPVVPNFDPGIASWVVYVAEQAGKAYAAGPRAWYAFLALTVHPSERLR